MRIKLFILALAFLFNACAVGSARTLGHASTRAPSRVSPNPSLERGLLPRVFFPFDSDSLMPESVKNINYNADWMKENSGAYIILEGHCDKTGPNEYNVELGDRRARSVEAYMIEQGIPEERIIMIVSYGSGRPLNLGHGIEDLRENRRVEFIVR